VHTLPVQHSGGTFTVPADQICPPLPSRCAQPVNHSTQPGVEPAHFHGHGALQQSLELLRRFVEDEPPWDAS
jgi:hypothetical protein